MGLIPRAENLSQPLSETSPRSRVLIISPQPFYEDRGTPIALRHVASALSDLNFDTDLLTFAVGRSVEIDRVSIHRTANPLRLRRVPIGFSFRKVFFDLLLFWKARSMLKRNNYSYVHAVEEGVFIALMLCRNRPERLIYDMQSSLPEQLAQHRAFRVPGVPAILKKIESWALRGVDFVVCSAGLAPRVRAVRVKAPVREWWFPVRRGPASRRGALELRSELRIPDSAKVFLYAGSFASYQGLSDVVAAISKVVAHAPKAFFVFVGATNGEEAAVGSGLTPRARENLRIVRRQPRDELARYMAMADFLLLPRALGHNNVPLKLFEYMASGKPILASRTPAHEALLDGSRAQFFDLSNNGMAKSMLKLIRGPEPSKRQAELAARLAQEELSWCRFVGFVGEIYGEGSRAMNGAQGSRISFKGAATAERQPSSQRGVLAMTDRTRSHRR